MERYYRRYTTELREDIDDRFGKYFQERIGRLETLFGRNTSGRGIVDEVIDVGEYYRQRLTRTGLNILCEAGDSVDLERIRRNLRDGYAGPSINDAVYLEKVGECNDILLIASPSVLDYKWIPQFDRQRDDFESSIAKCVLAINRRKSSSLLSLLGLPAPILWRIVKRCAAKRFSGISHDAILKLLLHESAQVRKATAIKAVEVFSVRRIRSVLEKYIEGETFYYNVIHWLDVGASLVRGDARSVVRIAGD